MARIRIYLTILFAAVIATAWAQKTYSVALTGDVMMGTTFPTDQLPGHEGAYLFRDVKGILRSADVAAGNLEGVLCDSGATDKIMSEVCYAFRTPKSFTGRLKDAGYDFMSVANNHAYDFGLDGVKSTEHCLDSIGIAFAGIAGRREYTVIRRAGLKFGFAAFGHNPYTVKHLDEKTVRRVLARLRPKCDIMIVSFHGGAEGRAHSHLPYGTEEFLEEDRGDLRTFAHLCVDLGADIVYGHGPHVARCIEMYKNRFIAYSLGNFCTPYSINLKGISGYAPLIVVNIDGKGKFLNGRIHSFIQTPGRGPRKDASMRAAKEIRALTASDIETPLINISSKGYISRK